MNNEDLKHSVIGEVKKIEYLDQVVELCHEDGLIEVNVKYLGGKEVLLLMQNEETVENLIKKEDHIIMFEDG